MRVQSSVAYFTLKRFVAQFLITLVLGIFYLVSIASVSASVESSVRVFPLEQELKLKAAQQSIKDKKYEQALQLAQIVLSEYPQQHAAQFIRARALSELGKLNEAIASYKLILQSSAASHLYTPEIYNNLATLYARQGNLDLARQTLETGIATNERYKTLYDNLSAIYVEMARGAYSKALKLGVQTKSVKLKTLQLSSLALSKPRSKTVSTDVAQAKIAKTENTQTEMTQPNKPMQSVYEAKLKTMAPIIEKPKSNISVAPIVKQASIQSVSKALGKKPVAKKILNSKNTAPKINKDEVITALHGWAAAWSAQAVDLYLSFYGKDFKPVKLSRKVWAVQRRIRLNKPRWVSVRLKDFNVKATATQSDKAIVQLVQDYRADNYHDKTKKQFVMQRTVDGWRILSEKSLAVIR